MSKVVCLSHNNKNVTSENILCVFNSPVGLTFTPWKCVKHKQIYCFMFGIRFSPIQQRSPNKLLIPNDN